MTLALIVSACWLAAIIVVCVCWHRFRTSHRRPRRGGGRDV